MSAMKQDGRMPPVANDLFTRGGRTCPVCEGQVTIACDLGDFSLAHCAACGCYASDALPRRAVTSFEPERYFGNSAADHRRWSDVLAKLDAGPRRLLDVGCGTGEFLDFARKRATLERAVGIELDEERAETARRRNPDATVLLGDATESLRGLGSERFDLITMWDVLEHVPAPVELVDALARHLAPSGSIVIQTIHENSLVPRLGRSSYALTGGRVKSIARRTHEPHHLVFFSEEGLSRLARHAGLQVRRQWFDRLDYARIDGNRLVAGLTAAALALENALGNGLFINVILGNAGATTAPS